MSSQDEAVTARFAEDYTIVVAGTLVFYDYISTLHLEVALLWQWSWSKVTVIYFIVRYLALILLAIDLWTKFYTTPSPESCRWLLISASWLTTILLVFSEVILMVRTWAICRRDRRVGCAFTIAMLLFLASCCYANVISWTRSQSFADPYRLKGCFITLAPRDVVGLDSILISSVQAVLLFALISTYRKDESKYTQNKLLNVIYTDGIMFYICILVVAIVNYITDVQIPDFDCVLAPLQVGLSSILATRVIFHIRAAALGESRRILSTELDELYNRTPRSTLVFGNDDNDGDLELSSLSVAC